MRAFEEMLDIRYPEQRTVLLHVNKTREEQRLIDTSY